MLQENEVLPGDSFSASVTGCCEEQMNCFTSGGLVGSSVDQE